MSDGILAWISVRIDSAESADLGQIFVESGHGFIPKAMGLARTRRSLSAAKLPWYRG